MVYSFTLWRIKWAFNRTSMELKLPKRHAPDRLFPFNRTSMELKP